MKQVTVRRDELLGKVEANRTKHVEEFRTAISSWQLAAATEAELLLEKIRDLEPDECTKEFPALFLSCSDRPVCHVRDYDRAIAMLRMHEAPLIEISAEEFDQLVNDEWDWKNVFIASNRKYS